MEFHPTLIAFRIYLLLSKFFDNTVSVVTKAFEGAVKAFEERTYYFLKGYTTPYHIDSINIHASTSAAVDFVYTADTKVFRDVAEFTLTEYLPLLSLEIIRDNNVIYDLTDFIETMTVVADVANFRYPSISQIVNAWAIDSKIVFDANIPFMARCVSNTGETYEFKVTDTIDLSVGMREADYEDGEIKEPQDTTEAALTT